MILMNLFSVFDPTSYMNFSMNWIILMLIFVFYMLNYYMLNSKYIFMMKTFMNELYKVFKEIAELKYLGLINISLMCFIYLIMSNLLGLFPFVFTSTAHCFITMGLGLVMWMSYFFMGFIKNFSNSMAHLVPEGSPLFLSPFMVLIESISHLMRPFTLSVRLAANMMAGHLIVGLLSMISLISFSSFFLTLMFQSLLLILEFGVSLIQGFVFSILLLLYSLEYY